MYNVDGDGDDSHSDDTQVIPDFFGMECLAELLHDQEEVDIEVDAEQDHEYRNDDLLQSRVISAAGIQDTETTGAGCSERDAERVKQRHAGKQHQGDLQKSQSDIDRVENLCRGLYLGKHPADGGTGALRLHQGHVVAASTKTRTPIPPIQ